MMIENNQAHGRMSVSPMREGRAGGRGRGFGRRREACGLTEPARDCLRLRCLQQDETADNRRETLSRQAAFLESRLAQVQNQLSGLEGK